MEFSIPGRRSYDIGHVILDMNGTISLDGTILDEVGARLAELSALVHLAVITADTYGGASKMQAALGLETVILHEGDEAEQKAEFVRRLGADRCIAIGNGSNDLIMLKESAIGICVIGREGASAAALVAADVVASDIRDALDLVLKPQRMVATLRS